MAKSLTQKELGSRPQLNVLLRMIKAKVLKQLYQEEKKSLLRKYSL